MVLKSWYITWEGVQRKGDWKTYRKKIKKYDTKGRTPDSWLYYSGYAEDDFYILYLQLFFQTIHDHYILSKIKLVLSPMLFKFIVWACWARTQSCFGVQAKTGPYNIIYFFLKLSTFNHSAFQQTQSALNYLGENIILVLTFWSHGQFDLCYF